MKDGHKQFVMGAVVENDPVSGTFKVLLDSAEREGPESLRSSSDRLAPFRKASLPGTPLRLHLSLYSFHSTPYDALFRKVQQLRAKVLAQN